MKVDYQERIDLTAKKLFFFMRAVNYN